MNIFDAFQNAVKSNLPFSRSKSTNEPLIQLNSFPMTINPDSFKNARSNSNPEGSLRALYNFRNLVDPIPRLGDKYSASLNSTERVYGDIIQGANTISESDFILNAIVNAKEAFEFSAFSNIDGIPGSWRPIYAIPEDWHSADDNRFQSMNINLQNSNKVNGEEERFLLNWNIDGNTIPVHTDSKIEQIEMKYMIINLQRPWFDATVFNIGDWFLSGMEPGSCSSGVLDENNGLLPLIPTGIILGKSFSVKASWDSQDINIINKYKNDTTSLHLGPFLISGNDNLHIVGWINQLMSFSPKIGEPKPSKIEVFNKGAFIARFSATWKLNDKVDNKSTDNFPVLVNKNIEIPGYAKNISIKIDIMTFPPNIWSTVKTILLDTPQDLSYELSGTTFKPVLNQIT